jgi:adenylate cyclase
MKRFVKWALLALAAFGCWAAIQQARQVSDLPAVRQAVVTTRPGVTPDVIQVTYFSSDVRCATCVRIERLTKECVERNFAPELQSGRIAFRTLNLDGAGNEHFVQDYLCSADIASGKN